MSMLMHSSLPDIVRMGTCLLLITASGALTGCDGTPVKSDAYFHLEIGAVSLDAQLAIDPATQTRGLMYRETLGENNGMLFISDRPRRQSFWMRNTIIALDIGFFTEDGILRETYTLLPRDEVPVKSRRDDIFFALEMNRGWFRENGIHTGERLNLALVEKARRSLATGK